jgi:hypothetical protein
MELNIMTRNDQMAILNQKYQFKFKQNLRVSTSFIEIFKIASVAFFIIGLYGLGQIWKESSSYLVKWLSVGIHYLLNESGNQMKTISQALVNPRFYISVLLYVVMFTIILKGYIWIIQKMLLLVNYKTWFVDTNPQFKPFLCFKGEELVPENRDSVEYGIQYKILELVSLKMTILANTTNDQNQNMYKVRLTQGETIIKEEELSESALSSYSRGFRLK